MNDNPMKTERERAQALGNVLTTLMARANLSARELGRRSDVSGNHISNLARGRTTAGKVPRPDWELLKKLADGFAFDTVDETVDHDVAGRIYNQLIEAAGIVEPAPPTPIETPRRPTQDQRIAAVLAEMPDLQFALAKLEPREMSTEDREWIVSGVEKAAEIIRLRRVARGEG